MDKREIVRKLVPVFRHYGYEGATLSRISKATGLGRASLYHHFSRGKQGMAEAVLSYLNECFDATILEPLRSSEEPIERLKAMSDRLNQFYNHGQNSCILSTFSLGEGRDLFHAQVQQALKTWVEHLAEVLTVAGLSKNLARQRAEDAVIEIQGALVLTRGLNCTDPFERVLQQLPDKLLKSA
ncbi:MAG: TetR/AcrR family transcriptional regulator [Cyanobacteria bacterium SID2]|nr:TetR/AcrR family transcriptional regulator [Cyanobacteria bacterium SID2]MBP0005242.1 TetR/AcrR family transcriptional regulator [Cyanobacteria bacterium SBC]